MPTPKPPPPRWTWLPLPRGQAAEPFARQWLGERLDCAPEAVPLQRDGHGRPQLVAAYRHWDCNWSHSGEGLLVALGQRMQVGIDLEWVRPRLRALELARRFFTAAEAEWLAERDESERSGAFVRLWCAKEAVLKAHGQGLSFGLHKLAFQITAQGLRLAACDPELGHPSHWTLRELEPAAGYVGALAWRNGR